MKHVFPTTTLAVAALSLGDCATQSAAQQHAATLGGPVSRIVKLPSTPGADEPRKVRVLADEPALKLASIVLWGGTALPTHHSEVPVTIMALQDSSTMVAKAERRRLDSPHAVVLAPNGPHAVAMTASVVLTGALALRHWTDGKAAT